jgi:hypothetical protein
MNEKPNNRERECLRVDGLVHRSRSFSFEELLTMDTIEASDLLHACGTGEPKGRIGQCRGVLLTDVIGMVEVKIVDHNDTKKMYLSASSEDGYVTVFSWQELFNTQVGEGVMIVLERDGEKVHGGEHVDLLSTNDFLTGPRYVKRLATLRVRMVE